MAQEQFEVGRWVFYMADWKWVKVEEVTATGSASARDEDGRLHHVCVEEMTANPVIPPKPKRTVKKVGYVSSGCIVGKPLDTCEGEGTGSVVRVTYEVEE